MKLIFESDICENIYELIANTDFKQDSEVFFQQIRNKDTDFELNKSNCKIEITDNENNCVYTITVQKKYQF